MNQKRKSLAVSSAGWETRLTKDRLNKVLPRGRIIQKKNKWYYRTNGKEVPFKGKVKVKIKRQEVKNMAKHRVKAHYRKKPHSRKRVLVKGHLRKK